MPFLAWLARAFLLRRLFEGRSRRRHGYGYGSSRPRHYGGHRRRRSSGLGWVGPLPVYSRRTRGGGRVSVGGCCLPIPLTLGVVLTGALRMLIARR